MAHSSTESCSCPRCSSDAGTEAQHAEHEPRCYCPLDGIIDVIARKHAMQVVSQLGFNGPMQYSDLRDALDVSSEATLSDNLKRLAEADLVDREVHDSTPPQVEYSLTDKGRELEERLKPLLKWAAEQ